MSRVHFSLVRVALLAAALLLPLSVNAQEMRYGARTPHSLPPPTMNVYDTMESQKELGDFVTLIDDAGLKPMFTVAPEQSLTVFAPTNTALGEISRDTMKRIKASKAGLQSFVKYHVITGSMVGSSAIRGRKASPSAANGETLNFDGMANPPRINDAKIVQADIKATDGIIHVVDEAMVPTSLKNEPAAVVAQPVAPTAPTVAPVASPAAPAIGKTTTGTAKALGSTVTSDVPGAIAPAASTTSGGLPSAATTTGAVPEVPPNSNVQPQTSQPVGGQNSGNDNGGVSGFMKKFDW